MMRLGEGGGMVALGRLREACALVRDRGKPLCSGSEPRRAPVPLSASAIAYLLPLLGLLSGCSAFKGPWLEAPLPPEVSPQGIQAHLLEPATPPGAHATGLASGAPPAVASPPQTAALPQGSPALPEFDKPSSPQVFSLPEAVAFGLQNSP